RVHSDLPPGSPPVLVTDCLAPEAKEQIAADANVQLLAAGWSGMLSAIDGEIVMQFNTGLTDTNNSAVLATISHLRQLLGTENATSYSLWLEDPTKISQTADQIRKLLSEAGVEADVYVWTEEALSPMYVGTMEFL